MRTTNTKNYGPFLNQVRTLCALGKPFSMSTIEKINGVPKTATNNLKKLRLIEKSDNGYKWIGNGATNDEIIEMVKGLDKKKQPEIKFAVDTTAILLDIQKKVDFLYNQLNK
jgi:hypothetical protein